MSLREAYPDSEDPERQLLSDYKSWRMEQEFYKLKPKELTRYQNGLLSIFYKCRKYSEDLKPVPLAIIDRFCDTDLVDHDVAAYIVGMLDSHFLKISSEKVKRDIKNAKEGSKK